MSNATETFLFTPLSIPGGNLQLWLDGADVNGNGVQPAQGAAVTTWVDKSGIGNNASGGVSPTFSNNGVVFNGSTQYLTTNYSASLSTETLFFVGTATGSLAVGKFNTLVASSVNGGRHLFTNATALNINNQSVQAGPAGGTITLNQITLFEFTRTTAANGVILYLNGTSVATGSLNAFTAGLTTWIGRWPGSSVDNWQGPIYEILGFNTVLNSSQREQIEGYLAWKWGLQSSLISSSPFKFYRPLANNPITTLVPPMPINANLIDGFIPTQISGCQLWLDAKDPSTINLSGTAISQWRDKSGQNNSTTGASGTVTYNPNGLNSLPTTTYNGTSFFTGGFATANTGTAVQMFLVAIPGTTANAERLLSLAQPGAADFNNNSYCFLFQPFTNTSIRIRRNVSGFASDTITPGSPFIVQASQISTTATIGVNGNLTPTTANTGITASFNITSYAVGQNTNTGDSLGTFTGSISEIIYYNVSLNSAQIQQVEGYLAWKWGLQANLPAAHPYRNRQVLPLPYIIGQANVRSAAQWLPNNVSGLRMWLDAADPSNNGTIPANGASISTWTDKSGFNNNATEGTSARRPTYDSVNKRLFFNAGSNQLLVTNPAIRPTNIFVVGNTLTTGSENHFFRKGNSGGSDLEYFLRYNTTNTLSGAYVNSAGSSISMGDTPPVSRTNQQIIALLYNNSNGSLFQNGTQVGTTLALTGPQRTATTGATSLRIGAVASVANNTSAPNPTNSLNGYIYEILFYNAQPTLDEQRQIEGYLAWKWGLQGSLPLTHPFKFFPPSPP